MSLAQKSIEKHATHAITGFELQKIALHNLQHWGLKHTTKIILWILIDCYNPENGSVVFPSMEYIAETGAMSLTAVKEGIKELINKGLIIKSKRSKVSGNYNKYLITPKVQEGAQNKFRMSDTKTDTKSQNTASEWSENELLEQSDFDCFMNRTNKIEKIKNKVVVKKTTKDDEILLDYAAKMGIAKHKLEAYVIGIKQKGGAENIIAKHKEKIAGEIFAKKYVQIAQNVLEQNAKDRKTSSPPEGGLENWSKALREKLISQGCKAY